MRTLGIEAIGESPWGTHICLFYETREELLELLVPYFAAGLKNNEQCLWVTSGPLQVAEAKEAMRLALPGFDRYLDKGQLEILAHTDWYLAEGAFERTRVMAGWIARHDQAINQGYDGLRLSGDTFWLDKGEWHDFSEYEATINRVIDNYRMLAIGSYSLARCGPAEIIEVVRNHQLALIKREGRWSSIESSERKQLEAKILRAKQEWERTFDSIPDLMAIIDREHRIRRVNRPMAARLGLTPDQCIGLPCYKGVHNLSEAPPYCPHTHTMADGKVHIVEVQEARLGGDYLVSTTPLYDEQGTLVASVHMARDITERKRMEEALRRSHEELEERVRERTAELLRVKESLEAEIVERQATQEALQRAYTELKESEEFIRTILDAVDEGFAVIDKNYQVITANRAYLALCAKSSQEEVVGEHCYLVLHRWDSPCFLSGDDCAVKRTRESGEPCTSLHIHSGVDGRYAMCAETKAFPLPEADGQISKVICVVNDISERMRLEDQLRHAQKIEAIGTMAGGIAHDFNNIINVILAFASLMEMEMGADHPLLHHLRQIQAASDKATHLTRGLLAMSRKQIADFKPVNLNEIIESMEKMIGRIVGKSIRLEIVLSEAPLPAMADSGQISQVLMNLSTNARDVMPEGGVLRLETRRIEMDADFIRRQGFGRTGPYAVIELSDTGSGMDEETRRRIFEPYFTTKELGKGTGLGLSIVHGIIDQHQGFIQCASQPGQGTTFTAYLPLFT